MKLPITEDKLPQTLPVYLSAEIQNRMDFIKNYNQDNPNGLSQWEEYIEFLKRYISNPSIAYDYANKYSHYRNGAVHIAELGYDVTFIVTLNKAQTRSFVYVFKLNLNPQEFGLKIPQPIPENKQQIIRLTEAQFMNLLTECISEIIRTIA